MAGSISPSTSSGLRMTVGVGDVAVSGNLRTTLSTYGLGSCLGIVAYDSQLQVGGMLHLMLPHSSIAPAKALTQPAMFADTGLPLFFHLLDSLKVARDRLRIFIAGGASVFAGADSFKVGERNLEATMRFFSEERIPVWRSTVGGTVNRTLHLELHSGLLTLKTPGSLDSIPLGRPVLKRA